ncbi:hypothetical protein JX266_001414 [Neoarthrinium moseri]|nr:hypothetical protein JX266_001414 [Neoarthrinium moseri]
MHPSITVIQPAATLLPLVPPSAPVLTVARISSLPPLPLPLPLSSGFRCRPVAPARPPRWVRVPPLVVLRHAVSLAPGFAAARIALVIAAAPPSFRWGSPSSWAPDATPASAAVAGSISAVLLLPLP